METDREKLLEELLKKYQHTNRPNWLKAPPNTTCLCLDGYNNNPPLRPEPEFIHPPLRYLSNVRK